jgi:hypothetical protein
MVLVIGDVRIMRCQLCKQSNEDTIVPICCIGDWKNVVIITNLDVRLPMGETAFPTC